MEATQFSCSPTSLRIAVGISPALPPARPPSLSPSPPPRYFYRKIAVCLDRLGLKKHVTTSSNLIKLEKERAFGRAPALIGELNSVTQRIVEKCLKLQVTPPAPAPAPLPARASHL